MSIKMGEYSFFRSRKSADILFSLGSDIKKRTNKIKSEKIKSEKIK